jgi:hypothetical protein
VQALKNKDITICIEENNCVFQKNHNIVIDVDMMGSSVDGFFEI